jgi:hypothetical protein
MCLNIDWRPHTVIVEGFAPPRTATGAGRHGNGSLTDNRLVWASGKPEDVYLALDVVGVAPTLWICGTAFDLSEEEAHKLAQTLESVGLRIERQQPVKVGSTAEASL